MAVLTSFLIPGLTTEVYDQMSQALTPLALQHGILLHAAGPTEGGFQIIQIWPSRQAQEKFFRRWSPQR